MNQRRVLVTGSSRGIGRAIAVRLAQNGWKVALHSSESGPNIQRVAKELGDSYAGIYNLDLSNPSKAATLIEETLKDGPLHALVNNAGVYLQSDFIETDDKAFLATLRRTFAINWESPLMLSRAACRVFAKQGGGKILNVASRVGFKGEAGASLYSASKAALINLTRSLSVELAPKNIGVFGIAPGWVSTSMVRKEIESRTEEILSGIPAGRMATPEDCATTAAFLLSDEASYLTGQVVDINGASYFH